MTGALLTGAGFLAGLYLGIAFTINRAARSWDRGHAEGERIATARGKAALLRLNEFWAEQVRGIAPIPPSVEVETEAKRRAKS